MHYTDKEFDAFDLDKIGSSQGDVGYCGKGIYFTSMTSFGKSFGKYCLDCYINMENPLIVQELEDWQKENLIEYFAKSDEYKAGKLPRLAGHPQKKENRLKDDFDEVLQSRNFEDEDINQLCEDLTKTREYDSFLETGNIEEIQDTDEFRELMGNDEFAAKIDDYCLRDYVEMEPYGTKDLTSDKFHYGYWVSYAAQLTEWAKDNGFDGILSERSESGQIREIVVFKPNQIKAVDNLYPTKDDNFKDNSKNYLKQNINNLSLKANSKGKGDIRNMFEEKYYGYNSKTKRFVELERHTTPENALSRVQQEYFKDSVIRKNGELLICEHGTDADFQAFDPSYIGGDGKSGSGFYFTQGTQLTCEYEHPLKAYLNITNPITKDSDFLTPQKMRKFCALLGMEYQKAFNRGRNCDLGKYYDLSMAYGGDTKDFLSAMQTVFGVDGVISSNDRGSIVAFYPNQIKAIDNLYPTKSDNFRDNSDEYLNSDKCNSLKERLEVLRYINEKERDDGDDGAAAPAAHCRGRDEAELI